MGDFCSLSLSLSLKQRDKAQKGNEREKSALVLLTSAQAYGFSSVTNCNRLSVKRKHRNANRAFIMGTIVFVLRQTF